MVSSHLGKPLQSETVLSACYENFPMVAVLAALRNTVKEVNVEHILERVSKVEVKHEKVHSHDANQLMLRIWWKLDEGEYHVTDRRVMFSDVELVDTVSLLESLLDFTEDEVLQLAAVL